MVLRLMLIGLIIAASATTALAGGPYVGASGGATFVHKSDTSYKVPWMWDSYDETGNLTYHTGYAVNAAAGYSFDGFRFEAEYGHKDAAIDEGTWTSSRVTHARLTVDSYMVNAYYDYTNSDIVSPFIGGGVGYCRVELNNGTPFDPYYSTPPSNLGDEGFAYQLMAGLTAKLVKHVNLDLYYRFMGTTFDLKNGTSTISPYHSSNILAGLRYTF